MIYVALLRGINVGGNNKVDMKSLKVVFEKAGATQVKTYINSGNVIFEDAHSEEKIGAVLEAAIEKHFKIPVRVLIKSLPDIEKIVKKIPDEWQNNTELKCDVLFLWKDIDREEIIKDLPLNPVADEVKYVPGAVLWCIQRSMATKSRISKIVGTKLYKQITIRNCNTTRKLYAMMEEIH